MKVSELAGKVGLQAISKGQEREIEGVYISDMVSDIITAAKPGSVLITLQTHKSLIAAANLVNVAAVVIAKGRRPADDVIDLANKAGITLFTTEMDTWTLARCLTELGFK